MKSMLDDPRGKTAFRGKIGKTPTNMESGVGLLGKSYGPGDSTQSEQMAALQNRATKLAQKAIAISNPQPAVIDSLEQVTPNIPVLKGRK